MMVFWIGAAVLILAGLAFLALPLARDAAQGVRSGGREGLWIAVVTIPVVATVLYLWLGALDAVEQPQAAQTAAGESTEAPPSHPATALEDTGTHGVDDMAKRLEARLAANPQDAEGWVLLGRTYAFMKRHADAAQALRKARALRGDDPQLLADLAEALAVAQGNRMAGEPERLVAAALAKSPKNAKALWLRGVAHMQNGDTRSAAETWETLRRQLPEGSADAQSLAQYIEQLRTPDAGEADSARSGTPSSAAAVAGGAAILVRVELDPALASRASPGDKVFVYARAPEGPRMPLAIVQKQVRDLPFEVRLDESQAMGPGLSLARFPQVVVGARISRSGEALPKAGDLEGHAGPVPVGDKSPVAVKIAGVVR